EWDGSQWTLSSQTGPAPRFLHSMTYDSNRHVTVLFSGRLSGTELVYSDETWEWDGAAWTQRIPSLAPPPRESATLIYDSIRQVSLLFSGTNSSSSALVDTWSWDGAAWVRVALSGPTGRVGHAMAFDASRGVGVLFGGGVSTPYNDTWEWNGVA